MEHVGLRAEEGHSEILKYAREDGCLWDEEVTNMPQREARLRY